MDASAVLLGWFGDLAESVREEIEGLSPDELRWQPDPLANSIGVTVWHFSRWLDVLAVQLLAARPSDEELWFVNGWASHTGHDPRGRGHRGLGVVTGYTPEDVAGIPDLTANELIEYHRQVNAAVRDALQALPPGGLTGPVPGLTGNRTIYDQVSSLLQGCLGHLGEIAALRALHSRAAAREAEAASR